jgi:hypothetical protein
MYHHSPTRQTLININHIPFGRLGSILLTMYRSIAYIRNLDDMSLQNYVLHLLKKAIGGL